MHATPRRPHSQNPSKPNLPLTPVPFRVPLRRWPSLLEHDSPAGGHVAPRGFSGLRVRPACGAEALWPLDGPEGVGGCEREGVRGGRVFEGLLQERRDVHRGRRYVQVCLVLSIVPSVVLNAVFKWILRVV